MTITSNPFGLQPAYSPQGSANAVGIVGAIASGYNSNILKYQPIQINTSGNIVIAANTGDFLGAFAGVSWVDSQGVMHSSNQWVAGTGTSGSPASSPYYVWAWTDPNQVFRIQCDGSIPQSTSVGAQMNFSNIAAGSATTGLSAATASATVGTSGQAQLRIVALDPAIGNAWGDAFTIVQVQIAQHQYVANKTAV